MRVRNSEPQRQRVRPGNQLQAALPRLLPSRAAPPSPVCREAGSTHVEDYPRLCSLKSPQPWPEVSGNATWAFSFFPSRHAPRLLRGGEQTATVTASHCPTSEATRTGSLSTGGGLQLLHPEQRSRK